MKLNDKYERVRFNDDGLRLDGETLIDYLQGKTHAITALEIIDDYVLSKLPELQVISKYGADAFRYYSIGGANPGLDLNYNFEDTRLKTAKYK